MVRSPAAILGHNSPGAVMGVLSTITARIKALGTKRREPRTDPPPRPPGSIGGR